MTTMIFILSTAVCFANGTDVAAVNAKKYGMLTLLLPFVAIVLAFITKQEHLME